MSLVLFLFCVMVSVSGLPETQDSNLLIVDRKSRKENPKYIVKHVEDSLELTCEYKNKNYTEEEINLKWILPFEEDERVQNSTFENGTIKLSLSNLKEADSGTYICSYVNNEELNRTVSIYVRSTRSSCDKKFECDDSYCISIIYKCDGVPDCKRKNDEAPELCGENPCEGRINCTSGRCIPKEWCIPCDITKENCTNRHRPDCCPPLFPLTYYPKDGGYPQRLNDFAEPSNIHQRYDINFIQTTIYSIIGCALVFMIIVTILVIAICRVHMKRSPGTHIPNNRRVFTTTPYHRAFTQEIGVYDLDIAVNRSDGLGLLVTYNINNGVQIVGSPIEPPPYSEVACLPPREGPPPPYTISQPYDGSEELRGLRSDESPPKAGSRFLRTGLSSGRVSSEPSLLNINNRL